MNQFSPRQRLLAISADRDADDGDISFYGIDARPMAIIVRVDWTIGLQIADIHVFSRALYEGTIVAVHN